MQPKLKLTEYQQQYIKDNHDKLSSVEIAGNLKLSQSAVYRKMIEFGFKKPPAKIIKMEGYFDIDSLENWLIGNNSDLAVHSKVLNDI